MKILSNLITGTVAIVAVFLVFCLLLMLSATISFVPDLVWVLIMGLAFAIIANFIGMLINKED